MPTSFAAPKPFTAVLEFWFDPVNRPHWFSKSATFDEQIRLQFLATWHAAANGQCAPWRAGMDGRLAEIIVLDQFSRSLWRNTQRAFAQDPAALSLAMEGFSNGHYASLDMPWFRIVYSQPLGHCEGPDHLARIDLLIRLREEIAAEASASLQPIYQSLVDQAGDVRKVIAAFDRHPHRNNVLGRESTPAEEAYIAGRDFPHERAFQA